MKCFEARKLLDARLDGELPSVVAGEVDRHLRHCPGCEAEAAELSRLMDWLDAMPSVRAPASLGRRTLKAFRGEHHKATLSQWWRSLSLVMRGAVCAAATAGLICGVLLGSSLTLSTAAAGSPSYVQSLYQPEGVLP